MYAELWQEDGIFRFGGEKFIKNFKVEATSFNANSLSASYASALKAERKQMRKCTVTKDVFFRRGERGADRQGWRKREREKGRMSRERERTECCHFAVSPCPYM